MKLKIKQKKVTLVGSRDKSASSVWKVRGGTLLKRTVYVPTNFSIVVKSSGTPTNKQRKVDEITICWNENTWAFHFSWVSSVYISLICFFLHTIRFLHGKFFVIFFIAQKHTSNKKNIKNPHKHTGNKKKHEFGMSERLSKNDFTKIDCVWQSTS